MTLRIPLDYRSYKNVFELCLLRQIPIIAGSASFYIPSRREKYVMLDNHKGIPVARLWPTIDGEMVYMSPGEAARTELQRAFPNLQKVGWRRPETVLFEWRWPTYFIGERWQCDDATYVDLKGAYHQIYSRLWLDVKYPCGMGTMDLEPIAEALSEWKAARNSIIGQIRSMQGQIIKGKHRKNIRLENPYLSPHLWATVQAILNEIASCAIAWGAVYVATDGYILPSVYATGFCDFLNEMGLNYRLKQGEADIKAWACYKVGDKTTVAYRDRPDMKGGKIYNINLTDDSQPMKLLKWWQWTVQNYRELVCNTIKR